MREAVLHSEAVLLRFQAMAEATRLRIVRLLASGEHCVCELQEELGASQSRLSFHLRKLKEAGVVSDRRDGRWVYYSLEPASIDEMQAFLGGVKPEPGTRRAGGGQCDTR